MAPRFLRSSERLFNVTFLVSCSDYNRRGVVVRSANLEFLPLVRNNDGGQHLQHLSFQTKEETPPPSLLLMTLNNPLICRKSNGGLASIKG